MSAVLPLDSTPFRRDAQVIGLVGVAHGTSHFFHLILAPLFPWIKDAFGLSYAELGFLMTVFFIVSGIGQFLAGFLVDRYGALQVLFGGMALLGFSALGLAMSSSYLMLMFFAGVAGLGNSIFHPSDFTILNRRVSQPRLAHAFSWHGVAGSIGWAIAPPILAGLAALYSWHIALLFGAALAFSVLALLVIYRQQLDTREIEAAIVKANKNQSTASSVDFMKLPAVWLCFAFFAFTAMALGVIQSFTPAALKASYGVALGIGTACVTAYMLANAAGTLAGGFLAAKAQQHDRVVAGALGAAALIAAIIATGMIPTALLILFFALMGFGSGVAGPSRDLLVRAAAPKNATGRVYGVVYSGLDAGLAIAPPIFGALMDAQRPLWLFTLMAIFFVAALVAAMSVGAKSQRLSSPASQVSH
jgi:MFS transporter, FSR family, fosmidomycin resistance protein